jgi:hypothetical protein
MALSSGGGVPGIGSGMSEILYLILKIIIGVVFLAMLIYAISRLLNLI